MSTSEGLNTRQVGVKCTTSAVGKYYFVQLDTSECDETAMVVELAGAGGKVFGITYETTAAANRTVGINTEADACYLVVDGDGGGAISAGSYLKSDSSGRGVVTITDKDEVGAIALVASTTAGDIIPVMIRKFTLSI